MCVCSYLNRNEIACTLWLAGHSSKRAVLWILSHISTKKKTLALYIIYSESLMERTGDFIFLLRDFLFLIWSVHIYIISFWRSCCWFRPLLVAKHLASSTQRTDNVPWTGALFFLSPFFFLLMSAADLMSLCDSLFLFKKKKSNVYYASTYNCACSMNTRDFYFPVHLEIFWSFNNIREYCVYLYFKIYILCFKKILGRVNDWWLWSPVNHRQHVVGWWTNKGLS